MHYYDITENDTQEIAEIKIEIQHAYAEQEKYWNDLEKGFPTISGYENCISNYKIAQYRIVYHTNRLIDAEFNLQHKEES